MVKKYSKEKLEEISLEFGNKRDYLVFLIEESIKKLKNLKQNRKLKNNILFGEELNLITIPNLENFNLIDKEKNFFFVFFNNLLKDYDITKKILELFLMEKGVFLKGLQEKFFLLPKEYLSMELFLEKLFKLTPTIYVNNYYKIMFSYEPNKKEEFNKILIFMEKFNLKFWVFKGKNFKIDNLDNKVLINLGKKILIFDNEIKIIDD